MMMMNGDVTTNCPAANDNLRLTGNGKSPRVDNSPSSTAQAVASRRGIRFGSRDGHKKPGQQQQRWRPRHPRSERRQRQRQGRRFCRVITSTVDFLWSSPAAAGRSSSQRRRVNRRSSGRAGPAGQDTRTLRSCFGVV